MKKPTQKPTTAQLEKKVTHAITELVKEAQRPTYANVRDAIGGGSFRDLGPIIKAVLAEREARAKVESQVPDMPEEVAELMAAIWETAYRRADDVSAADRRTHAEEVKRLQEEIKDREGDIASAEDNLDKMTERAEAAEEIGVTLQAELLKLRILIAGLEGRLKGREEASKNEKKQKAGSADSPEMHQFGLFDEPVTDDVTSLIVDSEVAPERHDTEGDSDQNAA